jgi:hypothetical protein
VEWIVEPSNKKLKLTKTVQAMELRSLTPVLGRIRTTMRLLIAIVLGLAHSVAADGQTVVDACRAKIPPSVGQALTQRFPAYRLPFVTDSLGEDSDFDRANGGNGCLLVASGDFDGDGQKDFAVGLTPKRAKVPLVAVVLSRKNAWLMSTVKSWVDAPMRLYVTTAPPGVYTRTEALDGPLKPTERQSLRCTHAAVVVGATESTGIVYCYANKRWLHVWVSD